MSINCSELKDMVAVVTGGSRGIGRAIAFRLADEGARVLVADIDRINAKKTAGELTKKHRDAIAVQVDATKEKSVDEMVKVAIKEFEKIDILINNAGIMSRTRFQNISLKE